MSDLLEAWVQKAIPSAQVRQGILRQAGDAERQGRDYHFLIGSPLTSQRIAYIIHRFAGEHFMFALTAAQALQAGLLEPAVGFIDDGPGRPTGPWSISLDELKLEPPCPDLRQPIAGTITVRSKLPRLPEICLRLETSLQVAGSEALREASFFAYPSLRQECIRFEFDPLKKGDFEPQTVAAFLTICRPPDFGRGRPPEPLSNAAGALVNIVEVRKNSPTGLP